MDHDNLDNLLQEVAAIGEYLDQSQNITMAVTHAENLKALELKGVHNSNRAYIVNALFLKNDIFTYLHTSERHELHQASEKKLLHTSYPNAARELVGDARLSLELKLDQYKNILLKEDAADPQWMQTAFNAAAIYGMLGSLDNLRQKMSENFPDQQFLDKSADRKLIEDQPKP
jgi:hypothetical protein